MADDLCGLVCRPLPAAVGGRDETEARVVKSAQALSDGGQCRVRPREIGQRVGRRRPRQERDDLLTTIIDAKRFRNRLKARRAEVVHERVDRRRPRTGRSPHRVTDAHDGGHVAAGQDLLMSVRFADHPADRRVPTPACSATPRRGCTTRRFLHVRRSSRDSPTEPKPSGKPAARRESRRCSFRLDAVVSATAARTLARSDSSRRPTARELDALLLTQLEPGVARVRRAPTASNA